MSTIIDVPDDEQPTPRSRATKAEDKSKDKAKTEAKPKAAPRARQSRDKNLRESIVNTYQMAGTMGLAFGIPRGDNGLVLAGTSLANNAEQIADAWMEVADKNPKIKAMLLKFTEASAMGVLVGLHVSALMPILATRGILPEQVAAMVMANAAAEANATNNGNGA